MKIESTLYSYGRKGGYSEGVIIEIIAGFEFGIACLITASVYKLSQRYCITAVTFPVLLILFIILYFVSDILVKRYIWNGPDANLIDEFEKSGTSTLAWALLGVLTNICSIATMLLSILWLIID